MNNAQLIGRITKDIDLRYTQSGKAVVGFTLAVDRRKRDNGADFIQCVAWGKTAELMAQYTHKGSKIGVSGHIQTRNYEKNGQKVFVTEIVADEVNFLERKREESDPAMEETDEDDLPF